MDFAFNAFIISATPLAKETTLETEKADGDLIEIALTESCEIDCVCCEAEDEHPLSNNAAITRRVFFTGALCQLFLRQVFVSCRISPNRNRINVLSMKKLVFVVIALLPFVIMPAANAAQIKGAQGQVLTATATTAKSGSVITVSGRYFDETVGIYLGFCVVPKKGLTPSPCGGGINKAGIGDASYWISSNPPPYGVGLAEEFLPGGRFTKTIKVVSTIGKFDCRKIKCAITVRADHLRSEDRSFDLFIPVKIK